ncbi:MAG: hypothetical protein A3J97_15195 [Spirochaetes bacterium RIFOXYC1_FULL_54_7]|nr:MAG: hypothetical protein A3J97_15195 [Spirochaetes bacterium RIFOXYC1_FULL_54_7]
MDVYLLSGQTDADSCAVVQPDLIVVCDAGKIHDDGIHGAPDLVDSRVLSGFSWKAIEAQRLDR